MIIFGPAGTDGLGYETALKKTKKLKLGCLECAFTYGVHMKDEEAKKIGNLAKELGIQLSIHAPYFINLASLEKHKVIASKKRILASVRTGHLLGAKYVVFHPGFYQGRDKELVYQLIKKQMLDLQKTIKKNNWTPKLSPETTGKASQFGDLDELLRLRKDTKCHMCVDFAHIYARNIGNIDYDEVFKKLKPIKKLHAHFSGIIYSEKGERSHKLLDKSFFSPLAKALKKYKPSISIINESPDSFGDAIKMKKWSE